jgi:hypothetical protein
VETCRSFDLAWPVPNIRTTVLEFEYEVAGAEFLISVYQIPEHF